MASKFRNGGQTCVCANRILVQSGIHDRFVAALAAKVDALKVASGLDAGADIGPMINSAAITKINAHVADALSKGASRATATRDLPDQFADPVVLQGATTEMQLAGEETFGPVLPVIQFRSEEEAIALANDSEFGLQASVFTGDRQQAERVMRQLEVGGVSIDNVNKVEGNPWLSFGGRKQTGNGRARGVEGLMAFTRSKHVLSDPNNDKIEANWYPYTQAKHQLLRKFTDALFRRSPLRLLKVALIGLKLESVSQKPRNKN